MPLQQMRHGVMRAGGESGADAGRQKTWRHLDMRLTSLTDAKQLK